MHLDLQYGSSGIKPQLEQRVLSGGKKWEAWGSDLEGWAPDIDPGS